MSPYESPHSYPNRRECGGFWVVRRSAIRPEDPLVGHAGPRDRHALYVNGQGATGQLSQQCDLACDANEGESAGVR